MDIKNAPLEKFFYDIDTDGTGELSEYWKEIDRELEEEWAKRKLEKQNANSQLLTDDKESN